MCALPFEACVTHLGRSSPSEEQIQGECKTIMEHTSDYPEDRPQIPAEPPSATTVGSTTPMNVLAVISFVGSFFVSLLGPILGFIALSQIKRDHSRGRGLAIAGIIVGFANMLISVVVAVLLTLAASTALPESSPTTYAPPSTSVEAPSPSTSPALCNALAKVKVADRDFGVDPSPENQSKLRNAFLMVAIATPNGEHRALYKQAVDILSASEIDKAKIDAIKDDVVAALEAEDAGCTRG